MATVRALVPCSPPGIGANGYQIKGFSSHRLAADTKGAWHESSSSTFKKREKMIQIVQIVYFVTAG